MRQVPNVQAFVIKPPAEVNRPGTMTFELIAAGELEAVHIGRCTRVPVDSVEAYVQRLRSDEVARRHSSFWGRFLVADGSGASGAKRSAARPQNGGERTAPQADVSLGHGERGHPHDAQGVRGGLVGPPTADDVSITADGRRLDSEAAVFAWWATVVADVEAEEAAKTHPGERGADT